MLRRRWNQCISRFLAKIVVAQILKLQWWKKHQMKANWYMHKHFYCSFLVSVDYIWQSFKHTDKLKKCHFFGDVNVASMRIVKKIHSLLNAFLLLKCYYFHVYWIWFFFLFALYTSKFWKIASINCYGSLYKKKILKSTVWNGDITDKLIVISLSGGD